MCQRTLSFTPGTTLQTFTVSVASDLLDETNESVELDLSSPSNPTIGSINNPATLTIVDDDETPTLSIADRSVIEGDFGTTNAVITVTLSAASGLTVTVDYATA